MIYVLGLLFLAGLTLGAGGMNWWRETLHKAEESRRIAAELKLAEETAKAIEEGKNRLIDMQAAYEAGEQSVKIKERVVYQKVREYVTNNPALNNPICTIVDADILFQLNGAIAALRASATAGGGTSPMPNAGVDSGVATQAVGTGAQVSGGAGAVPGVRVQEPQPGGADGVPGQGVQRPPKPTAVK